MWFLAANSGELAAVLIPAVWTFLGIVVATLGTIAVQALKSRSDRTTASTSAASTDSAVLIQMAKEQGALVQRADDGDERFDMADRARARDREDLDDVLGFLDRNEPNWRHR